MIDSFSVITTKIKVERCCDSFRRESEGVGDWKARESVGDSEIDKLSIDRVAIRENIRGDVKSLDKVDTRGGGKERNKALKVVLGKLRIRSGTSFDEEWLSKNTEVGLCHDSDILWLGFTNGVAAEVVGNFRSRLGELDIFGNEGSVEDLENKGFVDGNGVLDNRGLDGFEIVALENLALKWMDLALDFLTKVVRRKRRGREGYGLRRGEETILVKLGVAARWKNVANGVDVVEIENNTKKKDFGPACGFLAHLVGFAVSGIKKKRKSELLTELGRESKEGKCVLNTINRIFLDLERTVVEVAGNKKGENLFDDVWSLVEIEYRINNV